MRSSSKLFAAVAAAGLVAIGGSAFTATSTIDDSSQYIGAVTQAISGVNVKTVSYTVDATDKTTGVAFHVTEDLDPGTDTITATISNGTTSESAECNQTLVADPGTGTDVACTFNGLTNVTGLNIVAS